MIGEYLTFWIQCRELFSNQVIWRAKRPKKCFSAVFWQELGFVSKGTFFWRSSFFMFSAGFWRLHVCSRHVIGDGNANAPACDGSCALAHRLTGAKSSSNVARLLRNIGVDVKDFAEKELLAAFRRRSKASSDLKPSNARLKTSVTRCYSCIRFSSWIRLNFFRFSESLVESWTRLSCYEDL